ncbi:curli assembly protein CsgC [Citrobacter amalonaticus]|uniref:Curli assembly protein n=1 Tax=Citrobacter amalonaticus TaxID=35703 RepID=A0A2S4RYD3_CITAM|nr:curli assembly chaperone CsgC [Citrobacter amalonaticus]POT57765.1 curli assembly protein CsgC [Citrobacter amalonaticus]POT76708.1 curli assembly protein CsgC [Citrobacter amalonaticus]POU65787.1 curli assembly protein CsgC [Citrobacter amalonaticus]POV05944.1 curli assembly protein CsgC [Citrobacter amalonaticus]
MQTLLLLAALSNQITFNTTRQGDIYTVVPQVTLTQSCMCRVQLMSVRQGKAGQSQTRQEKTLSLPANQPIDLMKLSLNITQEDTVKIFVTVSDGRTIHLTQQWLTSAASP